MQAHRSFRETQSAAVHVCNIVFYSYSLAFHINVQNMIWIAKRILEEKWITDRIKLMLKLIFLVIVENTKAHRGAYIFVVRKQGTGLNYVYYFCFLKTRNYSAFCEWNKLRRTDHVPRFTPMHWMAKHLVRNFILINPIEKCAGIKRLISCGSFGFI